MKLIVMSDSHGYDEKVQRVINTNPKADYFIHLGDLCSDRNQFPNMIMVRGNNDYDYNVPTTLISEFNGLRVYMTHGHRVGYWNRKEKLAALAEENECQLVLYGHTHVYDDEMVNGIRLLNPGSLMWNRDESDIGYIEIDIKDKNDYQVHRRYLKF